MAVEADLTAQIRRTERREDLRALTGSQPEATPLERATMLNSTFCVVQPRMVRPADHDARGLVRGRD
jgi:hypothetical protein